MMNQTAQREMPFDRVKAVVRRGHKIRLTGILEASDALEEVRILQASVEPSGDRHQRRIRAFLVRGEALSGEGLHPGDHVLIGETVDQPSAARLLVQVGGAYVIRTRSQLLFDVRCEPRILGSLIAIVRRGRFKRSPSAPLPPNIASRPAAKLRILRGQLGMLAATCANTRNPKLQNALRNEAERVRRQLQCGASIN